MITIHYVNAVSGDMIMIVVREDMFQVVLETMLKLGIFIQSVE